MGIEERLAQIAAAYFSNNEVKLKEIPEVMTMLRKSLMQGEADEKAFNLKPADKPAVDVAQSVAETYIICLEDGKSMRTLTRYIKTQYGLTPHAYRMRWKLPADYPMSCFELSRSRSVNFALGSSKLKRKKGDG